MKISASIYKRNIVTNRKGYCYSCVQQKRDGHRVLTHELISATGGIHICEECAMQLENGSIEI